MTSKRELETELMLERRSTEALEKDCQEAHAKNRRLTEALERVAKHYGFHDAYVREEWYLIDPGCDVAREYATTGYRNVFSPDALIADLDAIDQARSADEARARLGIKEEA